jgi:hypothetical protein
MLFQGSEFASRSSPTKLVATNVFQKKSTVKSRVVDPPRVVAPLPHPPNFGREL